MSNAVIIDALRTPIGKFGGVFAQLSAVDLGARCVCMMLERIARQANYEVADVQEIIEEVIIGNVLSAGLGQNIARQITLHSGLADTVPASTLNMVCGSSLKAIIIASQLINLGERTIMIAGGTESMSKAPYLLENSRWGNKYGDGTLVDSIVRDGLSDAMHGYSMGITGENIATKWKISRKEQDEFAYQSQVKVRDAETQGLFTDERIGITLKNKGKELVVEKDEFPRNDTTLETLATLKPAFIEEGSITAGNASGINDGAAMTLLMGESQADSLGLCPLARILSTSTVALDETIMGYGPYYAIRELYRKTNLSNDDIHYFEINEAFASQSLAVIRDLALDLEKVNPLGGAIALGHPIGATGARIVGTLAHALHRETVRLNKPLKGIASLCIGGGQACGILIESIMHRTQ